MVDKTTSFGKPVIEGIPTPVEVVLGKLAGGMKEENIMTEYDLKKQDVLNAVKYAL